MVTDLPSLIALVQVGVLEFHVWGARDDRLDRPDLLIFDLDPDPAVSWRDLADTALLLRGVLDELGLVPFVRSTGGKGLHLVAPIERRSELGRGEGLRRGDRAPARPRRARSLHRGDREGEATRARSTSTTCATIASRPRSRRGRCARAKERRSRRRCPGTSCGVRNDRCGTSGTRRSRLDLADPWADFEKARRPLTRAMRQRVGS